MPPVPVVLITGASGNLGQACVSVFTELGWNCALLDRSSSRLAQTFTPKPNSNAASHLQIGDLDLADPSAAHHAAQQVVSKLGRIDALVNTVGGYAGGTPITGTTLQDWDAMMAANLRPTLNMCQAVLPHMQAQRGGRIVNVASRHATAAPAGHGPYAAAKAAVVRLTEAIAHENRAAGISCNCVLPTTLNTPVNRAAMPDADHTQWLDPKALAHIIAFLCSPHAADLVGVSLPVGT